MDVMWWEYIGRREPWHGELTPGEYKTKVVILLTIQIRR